MNILAEAQSFELVMIWRADVGQGWRLFNRPWLEIHWPDNRK